MFFLSPSIEKRLFKDWFLTLELSIGCNLQCPHCPQNVPNFRSEVISEKLFIEIINSILEENLCFSSLTPFFRGEPFVNPRFIRQLLLLSSLHPQILFFTIHTNGLRLNSTIIKQLFLLAEKMGYLEIIVSVDAFKFETYSRLRKGGDLAILQRKIELLLDYYKIYWEKWGWKSYLTLGIQFVEMEVNKREWDDFFAFWSARLNSRNLNFGVVEEGECILKESPGIYLIKKAGSDFLKRKKFPFCVKPWISPIIGVDGRLTYCCSDWEFSFLQGLTIKDFSYSLKKFWYSEIMENVRTKFRRGEPPNSICKLCIDRGENLLLEYVN